MFIFSPGSALCHPLWRPCNILRLTGGVHMSTNAGTTFTGTCQVGLGGEVRNACARLTSGDKHEWWVLEGPTANISIKIHWHCEGLSLFGRCEEGSFFAMVEFVETYSQQKYLTTWMTPRRFGNYAIWPTSTCTL